ncbi:helix-hairpin-helix domain-containing protein [Aestuariicoccus sp. MJ-SS9]|uniref:helix-hairpin-helix domain-containing protein n=1 Tax=Aestuariicoccus sp. MJ-SS9 TaxID=3079855 RepID=UPI002912F58C|nr:helix-hairpin-helix domain-containing protein [Aestuariicoccus sp. MJ-SS9]MDU8913151.1 helix-hairpin-helix domain-containing protein [Aestuariicoccus sp. MJ-SS9]
MAGGLSRDLIADRLDEAAELLEAQGANRFRVRAYRMAADTVRSLTEDPAEILARDGFAGLTRLPNIGDRLARAIDEMCATGRWGQLERMRGEAEPEEVFQSVPGIGPQTARAIHETLHADTLEALEIAAHDGRLEDVPGIGPRKAAAIRASLASMLARRGRQGPDDHAEPSVAELLAVDSDYRQQAKAGTLRKIAPRRFNPGGEAWLPILHTDRDDWSYTALFSNTALAHDLGRTDDWVVIYFARDRGREHSRTVVTETRGPLEGRRVVRGREAECRAHYFAE